PGSGTGACRNSCDPAAIRKNARVIESPLAPGFIPDRSPTEIDPSPHFMNPMFRFAVSKGSVCLSNLDCSTNDGCNLGACNHKVPAGFDCDMNQQCCLGGRTPDGKACPSNATSLLCDSPNSACYSFSGVPVAAITPRDSVFRF